MAIFDLLPVESSGLGQHQEDVSRLAASGLRGDQLLALGHQESTGMTPLTADMLARFRQHFNDTVHLARDFDSFALVFVIPRGCVVRDFRAFCESCTLDAGGGIVMDPSGSHLLMLDPSRSGPLSDLPHKVARFPGCWAAFWRPTRLWISRKTRNATAISSGSLDLVATGE